MHAIDHPRYGGPELLTLATHAPPRPGRGEVLVRVRAASVNAADWFMLTGSPWPVRFMSGLFRPSRRRLGIDFAGEVVEVGAGVSSIGVGDAVFGEGSGTFAELAVTRVERLAKKPPEVTFAQAATLPVAGCTALQGMRDVGAVVPGHRVLVNGGSGSVGSFAIAVARALGAEVTAVCSERNAERARTLGASRVVDYAREDVGAIHERFDVFFDLVGSVPLRRCLGLLAPNGVYVSSVGRMGWIARAALASLVPRSRVKVLTARATATDLETLGQMVVTGAITPAIVREVGLADVPDALRAQGEGHAQGKTVIVID